MEVIGADPDPAPILDGGKASALNPCSDGLSCDADLLAGLRRGQPQVVSVGPVIDALVAPRWRLRPGLRAGALLCEPLHINAVEVSTDPAMLSVHLQMALCDQLRNVGHHAAEDFRCLGVGDCRVHNPRVPEMITQETGRSVRPTSGGVGQVRWHRFVQQTRSFDRKTGGPANGRICLWDPASSPWRTWHAGKPSETTHRSRLRRRGRRVAVRCPVARG